MDTVIAVRDGVRRYLFACLDLRRRFGLAVATPGMSSCRDFADLAFDPVPGPVDRVLSDNGSEYEGRFADLLRVRGIARYYTYPKTPKMNAHAERFNRTVQEEFLDYHEDLLWGDEADLAALNRKLAEWLLWHNGERRNEWLWASRPRPPPSPGSARCSTTSPDRRRPEPQNPRHFPPHRPTGRVLFSMRKCQIQWARTRA